MTPIILFSASLLFALFVGWWCFQDAAFFRNNVRLEKMRLLYIRIPIKTRLATLARVGATVERMNLDSEQYRELAILVKMP